MLESTVLVKALALAKIIKPLVWVEMAEDTKHLVEGMLDPLY